MNKKPEVYTLLWENEFILNTNEKSSSNNILLFIDEESKYMRLTYPSSTDMITRRNLERQVRQIQKRGFLIEELHLRVGQDFEYQMEEDREVSLPTLKDTSPLKVHELAENVDIKKLEQLLLEIKQIWIHKRTGEGSDMVDSLENGEPSYFVSFLASDYQKLNILINSLPNSISL